MHYKLILLNTCYLFDKCNIFILLLWALISFLLFLNLTLIIKVSKIFIQWMTLQKTITMTTSRILMKMIMILTTTKTKIEMQTFKMIQKMKTIFQNSPMMRTKSLINWLNKKEESLKKSTNNLNVTLNVKRS